MRARPRLMCFGGSLLADPRHQTTMAAAATWGGRKPRGKTVLDIMEGPFDADGGLKFKKRFLTTETPVLLRGLVRGWPAVTHPSRQWSNLGRLRESYGHHVVPVEFGTDYMHAERSEIDLASFLDYLELSSAQRQGHSTSDHHHTRGETAGVERKEGDKGVTLPQLYLAQHALLEQIPALEEDLELEALGSLIPMERLYLKNAWFGPQGAVSPLHCDPYNNLYLQMQGEKVWRMWDPRQPPDSLYLSSDPLQPNTSIVDPRDPYLTSRFPAFPTDQQVHCTIQAGDALFIPAKWWHHVEARSMSMSVSLWWT